MLKTETRTRMGSLAMINYNSLLKRQPADMPTSAELRQRVVLLGEEGKPKPPPEPDAAIMARLTRELTGQATPIPANTQPQDLIGITVTIPTVAVPVIPPEQPVPNVNNPRRWGARQD